VTNVHVVKRLFIQQKNFLHAVQHGTRVVLNVKHVRLFHFVLILIPLLPNVLFPLILGNGLLTLASYKDFSQDVYCKGNYRY
jgi:hypothetical protein